MYICTAVESSFSLSFPPSPSPPPPPSPNLYLVLQHSIRVELAEEFISCKVKRRDDLLRVPHQLGVEVGVEAVEVLAVHVQEGLLQCVDLEVREGRRGEGGSEGG